MTVQVKEFDLLVEVYKWLQAEGSRPELATSLRRAINRMHQERERAWAKNHRPEPAPKWVKDRLAKEDVPLMQRLLDAGYPREEMDHHESDLYVYVTPLKRSMLHGRWVKPVPGDGENYCSVCKTAQPWFQYEGYQEYDFCPYCGAKMDEEASG